MDRIINVVKERKFKYICFFWFIISLQFVIGSNMQTKGYSIQNIQDAVISILKIIFLSMIFISLHYSIMKLVEKIKKDKKQVEIKEEIKKCENQVEVKEKTKKYNWLKYFLIIIICWIPTLLAFYPAIISYDGGYQIRDYFFFGKMNHHPLLITILYTAFYQFGLRFLESPTLGMLLFSVFQMTFMALVFSYAVKFIEETDKKWLRNLSLIFYALFPYNQLFSMMTTKDVIFAGLTIIFIINLYKMLEGKYKFLDYVFLVLIGVVMLLSRNNAIFTLKVSLPFIILVLIKNKRNLIKIILIFLITIFLYQVINSALYTLRGNASSGGGTNDSILTSIGKVGDEGNLRLFPFSQAVAKLVNEKENELTEEEKEQITYYFKDYKELAEVYKSNIADNTAAMINGENINSDKKEFFKFMWQLGKKYPIIFIDSFLNTARGYWYLDDNSFNRIWNKERPETMGALELFCLPIGTGKYSVIEDSKLPKLKEFYKAMCCQNKYEQIPVLYLLFQPATYFYIALVNLLYSIYKRDKNKLVIAIFLFVFFASCFLAYCSIVRYIYPIIVNVPIMASLAIKNENLDERKRSKV